MYMRINRIYFLLQK